MCSDHIPPGTLLGRRGSGAQPAPGTAQSHRYLPAQGSPDYCAGHAGAVKGQRGHNCPHAMVHMGLL